ncbi:MAG: hypothetical protein FWC78_09160, partial [Defluviitaleaceae bacterium]|nr:hypothetical protein [Defluviitaleaceae bacterium]
FARREAENRRALAVRKVFSDEGLREIYKFYANVFRWSGYSRLLPKLCFLISEKLHFQSFASFEIAFFAISEEL